MASAYGFHGQAFCEMAALWAVLERDSRDERALIFANERRISIRRALIADWRRRARAEGCTRVMIGAQADESVQQFYHTMGYRDADVLLLPEQMAE